MDCTVVLCAYVFWFVHVLASVIVSVCLCRARVVTVDERAAAAATAREAEPTAFPAVYAACVVLITRVLLTAQSLVHARTLCHCVCAGAMLRLCVRLARVAGLYWKPDLYSRPHSVSRVVTPARAHATAVDSSARRCSLRV